MKQVLFISLLWLLAINASGQTQHTDSLIHVLETEKLSAAKQLKLYEEVSQFYSQYELEKGIEYAIKGLRLAEKEKDKKMISTFNKHLGIIYYKKADLDTSHAYLEKALIWALEAKDEPLQMASYGSLGNIYRLKQDYQEALNYYTKALALHNVPVNSVYASTFCNIAVIHRILNNPDRAIYYFEQALEVAEQLNLDEQKMEAIYGLATTFTDRGDYAKAEEYFQKTLEMSRKSGSKAYEIISINSLAICLCVNKEFDQALLYAQEGLRIAESYSDPRHILGAWGTLADIYREMGDYKKCEEAALKSWAMDSTSVEEASYTAYTLIIANIYLNQNERAEHFLNKYYEIMKTGNEKSLHNSLADMEVKYETEKKEIRIASLEKERELYIWLGIAGILLVFALVILLWLTIRNARKEKQLIATRSVLDGEMRERTRLAQDLHDRLSGNLSAVKIELGSQAEALQNIRSKLDNCIRDIRETAHNIMPSSLQFGIKVALEDFAAQFPNVRFHFFGKEKHIDKRIEYVVYCCANELVSNSIKHSGAEEINLQLIQDEKHITLTVSDNGCGFNEKDVAKGFGLKSIRNRVASCNGKTDTSTSPGNGTETTIELSIGN